MKQIIYNVQNTTLNNAIATVEIAIMTLQFTFKLVSPDSRELLFRFFKKIMYRLLFFLNFIHHHLHFSCNVFMKYHKV